MQHVTTLQIPPFKISYWDPTFINKKYIDSQNREYVLLDQRTVTFDFQERIWIGVKAFAITFFTFSFGLFDEELRSMWSDCLTGSGIRTTYILEFSAIKDLTAKSDKVARCTFGFMYEYGIGTEQFPEEAYNQYRGSAVEGYGPAQVMLARSLLIQGKYHEASYWMLKAAGNSETAPGYEEGVLKILTKWAKNEPGFVTSSINELFFTDKTKVSTPKQYELAIQMLNIAVAAGDKEAEKTLNRFQLYFEGTF